MTNKRAVTATATVAGLALMALPAAAFASTTPPPPRIGVGVALLSTSVVYFPTNHLDPYQSENDVNIGTVDSATGVVPQPFAPGSSRVYSMEVENAGNVSEVLGVSQWNSSVGVKGTPLPDSWVKDNASPSAVFKPGQSETISVTVTVPANAKPGLYVNVIGGTASKPGAKGNVHLVVGAGIREEITVS